MHLGVLFPTRDIGTDPALVREFAESAESLGYHHLGTANRDLGIDLDRPDRSDRYDVDDAFYPPFPLFAHLAAVTDSLRFVTEVLVVPQRQTALIAKQAAGVDVLSDGRLTLGVGVGSDPVSYEALGMDFHTRGRRMTEAIEVLRTLWQERLVSFEGEFHTIDGAGINPPPVQQPIPIWMGGGKADRVLRRIARTADGWIPSGSAPMADLEAQKRRIHEYMDEFGRDPDDLAIYCRVEMTPERSDEWVDDLARLAAFGATHVSVETMGQGWRGAEHVEAIGRFRRAIEDAGV